MTLYISHNIEKVTLIMGSDQHNNMIKLMGKILITSPCTCMVFIGVRVEKQSGTGWQATAYMARGKLHA